MSSRIVILVHPHDRFERMAYFMRRLALLWRERGIAVSVHDSLEVPPEADLAVLHVDLTRVPPAYLSLAQRYPRVINGRVGDISKRRVSRNLVRRGDGWSGPVLVKADRNCGGDPEARQIRQNGGAGKLRYKLRQALPWYCRAHFADYRVYPTARQVPLAVWLNPHLVVERFRTERRDNLYCLRTYVFLGDREGHAISYSHQPVVRSNNLVGSEDLGEVPPELRTMRHELGFDFGKFDYGLVDGEVVLYDANRTPTLGAMSEEQMAPRLANLAEGIHAFL